ncbi:hypothetical protein EYF80_006575 [Liparis tanakae]|uniref:Uncharacterized protein n=1 Tax=Liparis tanakae TaxID=230148 RepID=A0A4Z2J141_9TELE|nr:hypothetical protein EYF80_006575 [Liparis tanakae]
MSEGDRERRMSEVAGWMKANRGGEEMDRMEKETKEDFSLLRFILLVPMQMITSECTAAQEDSVTVLNALVVDQQDKDAVDTHNSTGGLEEEAPHPTGRLSEQMVAWVCEIVAILRALFQSSPPGSNPCFYHNPCLDSRVGFCRIRTRRHRPVFILLDSGASSKRQHIPFQRQVGLSARMSGRARSLLLEY